jgi:hypothetical protein
VQEASGTATRASSKQGHRDLFNDLISLSLHLLFVQNRLPLALDGEETRFAVSGLVKCRISLTPGGPRIGRWL